MLWLPWREFNVVYYWSEFGCRGSFCRQVINENYFHKLLLPEAIWYCLQTGMFVLSILVMNLTH